MKKIIISIVVVILAAVTIGAVAININESKREAVILNQLSERHVTLNAEKTKLLKEKAEYVALRDAETKMGNYLVLFFDSLSDNLIDTVYPLMEEYGHKGTIVMCDGLVPGEEGNISRKDFDFLVEKGWDTAIGYNRELDLSMKNSEQLLDDYLAEYTAKLTQAGVEIPNIYCFDQGEYNKKYEDVLTKYGFNVIRHNGETGDDYCSAYIENEFYYIGSGVCNAASTNMQKHVDEAYMQDLAFSMSVRHVANSAIEAKYDCTETKYERMLSYLQNNCSGTVVCTAGELYQIKKQQHASVQGSIGEHNKKIAEIDEKIAQIDKEMEEIISRF